MQGASKPVSHMSLTITSLSGSVGFLYRFPMASYLVLERICGCISDGSDALPVMTTFTLNSAVGARKYSVKLLMLIQ